MSTSPRAMNQSHHQNRVEQLTGRIVPWWSRTKPTDLYRASILQRFILSQKHERYAVLAKAKTRWEQNLCLVTTLIFTLIGGLIMSTLLYFSTWAHTRQFLFAQIVLGIAIIVIAFGFSLFLTAFFEDSYRLLPWLGGVTTLSSLVASFYLCLKIKRLPGFESFIFDYHIHFFSLILSFIPLGGVFYFMLKVIAEVYHGIELQHDLYMRAYERDNDFSTDSLFLQLLADDEAHALDQTIPFFETHPLQGVDGMSSRSKRL